MPDPAWAPFVGLAAVLAVGLVVLARASTGAVDGAAVDGAGARGPARAAALSPGVLLVNVALSQGLVGALLAGAAWVFAVPPAALGIGAGSLATAAAVGVALGAGLSLANEAATVVAARFGAGYASDLREALAPDDARGWAVLLVGVLPVVAAVEEFLFRGALVGAAVAGFAVPPAVPAALSSLLFGAAHGVQGRGGVVVATLLGAALATAFVLTGSLLAVVVAHYVVNALEFVVHEGWGLRPVSAE